MASRTKEAARFTEASGCLGATGCIDYAKSNAEVAAGQEIKPYDRLLFHILFDKRAVRIFELSWEDFERQVFSSRPWAELEFPILPCLRKEMRGPIPSPADRFSRAGPQARR